MDDGPGHITGFRSKDAVLDGTRLHYRIGGDPAGQPVLLWHGFLGSGYSWRLVAPMLAEMGYSVVIPDMRGFGLSDKPEGVAGYDALALAEECRSLVAAIGFGKGRPAIVCAHDMGAPPALLLAAHHPDEVAGLLYVEGPVMLGALLRKMITFTPDAARQGSMWWWLLPLAPGAPEALIVGQERAFLTWFYRGHLVANQDAFDDETIEQHLRTFTGRGSVLGAMGVYRAAFTSIDQTEHLTASKVITPVRALGGERSLGAKLGDMVSAVARDIRGYTIPECGHFIPEEQPGEIVRHIDAMTR